MDKPGEFRDIKSNTPDYRKTDAEGRFAFAPKLNPRGLIAIHQGGFADVWIDDFNGSSISLKNWGVVEGRLLADGQPLADETIMVSTVDSRYGENGRMFSSLRLWLEATTDAEGRFRIEKVPPGKRKLTHRMKRAKGEMGRIVELRTKTIQVEPGVTTEITMGEGGAAVVGTVVSTGDEKVEWQSNFAELRTKQPQSARPERTSFQSNAEFFAAMKHHSQQDRAFWTSPEGRQFEASAQRFTVPLKPGGSFRFEDVPPGDYELSLDIKELTGNSIGPSQILNEGKTIGQLKVFVTVPNTSTATAGEPIDLGILQIKGR